jgi:hypothetical protein
LCCSWLLNALLGELRSAHALAAPPAASQPVNTTTQPLHQQLRPSLFNALLGVQ